jgi:adenylate cyclase
VDDIPINRDLLARQLRHQGYDVKLASDGPAALSLLEREPVDVILLDVMMPEMDGCQVLGRIKAHDQWRHIPVVMLSALTDGDMVLRCVELGAEDYLIKPFNLAMLQARIGACLERKRMRDREQVYLHQLQVEQAKSEQLLLSMLPPSVVDRLKHHHADVIAESFPDVTILFADLVAFTEFSATRSALEVVSLLNQIFSAFDQLTVNHGLEKIKTVGDAYMVVGGLHLLHPDPMAAVARLALNMQDTLKAINQLTGENFSLRLGIHTGPVVAGVIGTHKLSYDLWGDAVNLASRMESLGLPDRIQVSQVVYQRLGGQTSGQTGLQFGFEPRGEIEVKGKGLIPTYWLTRQT